MNFSFLPNYYNFFLEGAKNTVLLALFTVALGVVFGIVLALMRISKNKIFKFISSAYVEIIRGTPLMVQIFIVYYGLPVIGINIPSFNILGSGGEEFAAGIIALSINSAAYVAEIIRSGIQSVNSGQMEAARSLGMSYGMSMRHIIIPQAFKNILPALGNEFIVIIKESSIVSIIGIKDLMYNANTVRGNTFIPLEPLLVAAVIYFVLTFSLSKLLGLVERGMKVSD